MLYYVNLSNIIFNINNYIFDCILNTYIVSKKQQLTFKAILKAFDKSLIKF